MLWRPVFTKGVLSLVLVLFQGVSHGQPTTSGQWTFHAVGAGQSIWLNDPLGTGNGPLTGRRTYGVGYLFGAGAERSISTKSGVRMELQWNERNSRTEVDESQIGYRETDIGTTVDVGTRRYRLRAVQMPLLFRHRAWPDLDLLAGPVVSRMLGAQEQFIGSRYSADGQVEMGTLRTDRTSRFRPIEWAFLVGFEVEGHAGLRFGLRYCAGLTDLEREEGTTASLASTVQVVLVVPILGGGSEPGE